MRKLTFIIALFIIIALPVNVFAQDDFISNIIKGDVYIKGEASIFELAVYVTKRAINIMDSVADQDEAYQLLDELFKEYEIEEKIDSKFLLNEYRDYQEYFEEESKEYIEYNKNNEVFEEISSTILKVVANNIEEVTEQSKSDLEMRNSITEILEKYNLKNDLNTDEIIYDYYNYEYNYVRYDVFDDVYNIFQYYKLQENTYYNIEKLINEIDDLNSEDEIINVVKEFLQNLEIQYNIEAKEILDTYRNYKTYGYDTEEEALYSKVINIIKDNNIENKIYNIHEEIIDDIDNVKKEFIEKELHDLLKTYGIESMIDEYRLIRIFSNYQEYGYENQEEAILKEGLKALDVSYSEKIVKDIINRIVDVINSTSDNYTGTNDLDADLEEIIYEEIDRLYDIFNDYNIKDNIDLEKIIDAFSKYKENGYDNYEDAIMAAITEMFKNTKLEEEIVNIINGTGDINEIEKIREKISDFIEDSKFEKYIDYNAIEEIINTNTQDNDYKVKALSDIMMEAIVASNEEDILDIFEEAIEEIDYYNEKLIKKEKSKDIKDILEKYGLEEYVDTYNVMEVCLGYKELDYNSQTEALFEELFTQFTKSYSKEEKVNIGNQIRKIINEEKSNNTYSKIRESYSINKILDRYDLNNVLPMDILNIYYYPKAYGYDNIKEGIMDKIIDGISKRIQQDIIEAINSGKEEGLMQEDINRILRNNYLDSKIDAVKILNIYNNYKDYGLDNSAEALSKELTELFKFVKNIEPEELTEN